MLSLRCGPSSLVLWLFLASACWGQAPRMTLNPFSSGVCPRHGVDKVRVEGAVDISHAIPGRHEIIEFVFGWIMKPYVLLNYSAEMCISPRPAVSCSKVNNSYFKLVYEAPAEKDYSGLDVRLRVINVRKNFDDDFGNTVCYPVVKEGIREVLKIGNTVLPLERDTVEYGVKGTVVVAYEVTGVSLSKLSRIEIMDSSYKELVHSTTSSQVSTEINTEQTRNIFVTYNTTNGCYSGSTGLIKVVFKEPFEAGRGCREGACVGGIVAGVLVVVMVGGVTL